MMNPSTSTAAAFVQGAPLLSVSNRSTFVPSRNVGRANLTRPVRARAARNCTIRTISMNATPAESAVVVKAAPPIQQPPAGIFASAAALGELKGGMAAHKTFVLGILAGALIAVGGYLALCVGGSVPALATSHPGLQKILFGLIGLPTGLTMVVVTGGDLFTGNTMLLSAALFTGRTKMANLLRNWVVSFIGNIIGALLLVKLISLAGLVIPASAAGVAVAKTSATFMQMFWRGLLCNWLVCLGIYMASGAADFTGKFLSVLLPISAFVAMGMEHSVANMFLVPFGMHAGAAVTIKSFLMNNLLPVTLGNTVAGVVCVALMYFIAFGKKKA